MHEDEDDVDHAAVPADDADTGTYTPTPDPPAAPPEPSSQWNKYVVAGLVVGPHLIVHALLTLFGIKYGMQDHASSALVGAVSTTQRIHNMPCGSPLLLVICVRHLLCVAVCWRALLVRNLVLQVFMGVYFCVELLCIQAPQQSATYTSLVTYPQQLATATISPTACLHLSERGAWVWRLGPQFYRHVRVIPRLSAPFFVVHVYIMQRVVVGTSMVAADGSARQPAESTDSESPVNAHSY